jgi:hypothetical protein
MMKSISQNSKVTKITLETREDTTKLYKKKRKMYLLNMRIVKMLGRNMYAEDGRMELFQNKEIPCSLGKIDPSIHNVSLC